MSVVPSYRSLLRSLRANLDRDSRQYYVSYVREQFRRHSDPVEEDKQRALLRIAQEYAQHLHNTAEHTQLLKTYNITVNRDGSQRENVAAIAHKVGLQVPAS
jgi:hypothetical protein